MNDLNMLLSCFRMRTFAPPPPPPPSLALAVIRLLQVECLWNQRGAPRLLAEQGILAKGMLHARSLRGRDESGWIEIQCPYSENPDRHLTIYESHNSIQISATHISFSRIFSFFLVLCVRSFSVSDHCAKKRHQSRSVM